MNEELIENLEMAKLRLERNRRNRFKKNSKEEKDAERFQNIVDQRYRENLSNLHNDLIIPEEDSKTIQEKALKEKKELESEKETIFLKKWE